MSKKKKTSKISIWPKITKGSHLTVTEHENGSVDLIWDNDALARDVLRALTTYEQSSTIVQPLTKRKTKSGKNQT